MSNPSFDRTIEIDVTGMTCAKCVQHVTEELEALPDVHTVSVILRKDAASLVTVVAANPIADDVLTDAVVEAGYEVAAIRRDEA